ncbi:hypothetical protein LINPERHAP1_LOCUS30630 [Linum perenne]
MEAEQTKNRTEGAIICRCNPNKINELE